MSSPVSVTSFIKDIEMLGSLYSTLFSLLYNSCHSGAMANLFDLLSWLLLVPLLRHPHISKIYPVFYSGSSRCLQIPGLRRIRPVCEEWVDWGSWVSLSIGGPRPLCSHRGLWRHPGEGNTVQVRPASQHWDPRIRSLGFWDTHH